MVSRWSSVCPSVRRMSVRPSVGFSFLDDNLSKHQWIFTMYVHWYCGDLVWDCWWANFVALWHSYLPETRPYFRFRTITWVHKKGFSPNLVFALILWRSGLGLLMGKFCQFLTELSAQDMPIFSFLDYNKGFSPNLLYTLTLRLSGLGLLMGKFRQIFMELSARDTPIFSFPDELNN